MIKIANRYFFLLLLSWVALPAQGETISIMTFNVENLFDNNHDAGKNDETYLPVARKTSKNHIEKCKQIKVRRWRDQCLYWDWNDAVVERKLNVIADSIKQVNQGQGPDIIAFQEIENLSILERLRNEKLSGLGYQPGVLIEGKDRRGIDVAFLSKYQAVGAKLHEIKFPKSQKRRVGDTRPILEATFKLPTGDLLTGLAVHFPAPFHPTEMRESAYTALNNVVSGLPEDRDVFAAGDFNTTREEDANKNMLERWVRPTWQVAHDLCKGCPGTSYYPPKDDWSFLDMIFWRASDKWEMSASYLANQTKAQRNRDGTPKRFELPEASGVSDHWPLVLEIAR
ncbi:MAG: hypothetical protein CNF01_03095 [Halieaceae bacterium MED-G27]|nr:hypothetical protein [Halieaceae bacterium]OUT66908.1 MAG: hypothetical protein CBB81_02665 [Cellvibrionales bacterium TMED21]PDH37792.1 MAG: hypothetical protein CNF01_03095 [Halieaceae bacterium MED-G27]